MEKKYEGRYLKLYEQKIDNHVFEKVFIRNSVQIIPFISDDEIILIKEERVAETPKIRLKLVTGFIEDKETPEECAIKELQEEIGKKPKKLVKYFVIKKTGSVHTEVHVFLAFDLIDSKLGCDSNERILEILPIKIDDAYQQVIDEEIFFGTASGIIEKLYRDIRIKKKNLANIK